MKQPIIIGKVLKPRGLKGELKCSLMSGISFEFCHIGNDTYKLVKFVNYDKFTFLTLDGITSVEQAEHLRGKNIEIDRTLIVLADDEVLTSDLIGFKIVTVAGKLLGTVRSIEETAGGDIIFSQNFAFPNEDAFIAETNMKTQTIVVRDEMMETDSV